MARLAISRSTATTVEIDGRELLYFGGCGYLGLAHHPQVVRALADGLARYGVSSGASRETTGNTLEHDALESELAQWLGCEAVLLTPEGATANLSLAQGLVGMTKVACIDELAHPSLFDAAAAAGFSVHAYAHGHFGSVPMFASAFASPACLPAPSREVAMFTDSVFPSRGEIAPLRQLAEDLECHDGLLVIDDCHGTGVIGDTGRGAFEYARVRSDRALLTSTLSKALGCYGGFVAGPRRWIERIRERSQAYVGTTPIPPAVAAAVRVALKLAFGEGELLARLRANVEHLRSRLDGLFPLSAHRELPVFAFSLELRERMQALHDALLAEGILAPYVNYPGGPANGNFRIVVTAAHSSEQIDRLATSLRKHLERAR